MSTPEVAALGGEGDAGDRDGGMVDHTGASEALSAFRSALIEINRGKKSTGALSAAAQRYGFEPSSRTTMHNVQTSTRLQSEASVRAYVAAATRNDSAEVERFAKWRNDLADRIKPPTTGSSPDQIQPPEIAPRRPRWIRDLVVAGCSALVTAVVTAAVTASVVTADSTASPESIASADSTPAAIITGADPLESGCADKAVRANADVPTPPMNVIVVFSQECNAVWGKIERLDGAGNGDSITVVVYRLDDPSGPDTQRVTERDVSHAFTPIIVRIDRKSPICVVGSVTVDDGARTVESTEPQCT
ncbi:hypothetical protein CH263_08355 [Rhodococcus sp. 06-1059B-a]|nr:DUF2690 domain-containing protein [Rhodococcus sp. 06-1059B-a]OZD68901.1 hypothetical protein CH263_08355 [Rhodococcus sp. 06-1059B-a]